MPIILICKPVHFWFHTVKVVGELCDEEVIWQTEWTTLYEKPDYYESKAPTVWTDGPYCVVYPPMSDTERQFLNLYRGTLSITATVKGIVYGPINLIIEEPPI